MSDRSETLPADRLPTTGSPRAPCAGSANHRSKIGGPAPRVGEHSREILPDIGYDDASIDALIERKTVRAM
ncbi:hypothetical protein [Bradyrhizobium centrosematis]|uniref:hypothetical protein n=1 Tax=Bradyrhizobium centrosematis TaxID=1300039 RepID=UPI0021673903|nr:hypothetical protein [Bradyrhizobium centrosematis]MCS3765278.1 crotonobetainyl-CoA:carnitine CoA-transferase CaiB-like acyl-CoA transferase [Bradyrhizobium centrosematis]MCS3774023.1 crotonobetainyl-CoA:carnitine CoA-transferase CaiB-like acyl-CoA transferase [Bradyrhizobium centrosematis]